MERVNFQKVKAEAAYQGALSEGYTDVMRTTVKATVGAMASVVTLGLPSSVYAGGVLANSEGVFILGKTLVAGGIKIWDTYEKSMVSNTVNSVVELSGWLGILMMDLPY